MIGHQLKQLRESRQLKQSWVASQTKISQGEISKIERGKRVLSIENLDKFIRFYGLGTVEEIVKNIFK
jgi:transcriptional regulator with XRE-family HTH domain